MREGNGKRAGWVKSERGSAKRRTAAVGTGPGTGFWPVERAVTGVQEVTLLALLQHDVRRLFWEVWADAENDLNDFYEVGSSSFSFFIYWAPSG